MHYTFALKTIIVIDASLDEWLIDEEGIAIGTVLSIQPSGVESSEFDTEPAP